MENHHFQWVNPLEIAIFNSYGSPPLVEFSYRGAAQWHLHGAL